MTDLNDPHAFTSKAKDQTSRAFSLHRNARKRFPTRSYRAKHTNQFWQADLNEMIPFSRENKGMKYILTVVDVFSRYAWARALPNKTAQEVVKAFKSIFKKDGPPLYLHTDEGKEFENSALRSFFVNTHQFSVKSPYKAAIVERFNRTLKGRMYKYFTHVGNYGWIKVLQKIIDGYNNTVHRTIKMTPAKAYLSKNRTKIFLAQAKRISSKKNEKVKFKVGDFVRLSKSKGVFEKGFTSNWTEEIFRVTDVNQKYMPIMYSVKDLDGQDIQGKFYKFELQKVDEPKEFAIEKIVRKDKSKSLVKFVGYKQLHWISNKEIKKING